MQAEAERGAEFADSDRRRRKVHADVGTDLCLIRRLSGWLLGVNSARQQYQDEQCNDTPHQSPFFGTSHDTDLTPGPARHQLRAEILERQVGIDRRVVGDDGFLPLRDFSRLEDHAVARKDALHVIRRKVASFRLDLDHQRARPVFGAAIEEQEEDAEKCRGHSGHGEALEATCHPQRHQQEDDGDIFRVFDRRAEPDDAGGAGNAEGPGERSGNDDHHHRPRDAEEDLRVSHGPAQRPVRCGGGVDGRDQHADQRGGDQFGERYERRQGEVLGRARLKLGDAGVRADAPAGQPSPTATSSAQSATPPIAIQARSQRISRFFAASNVS